MEEEKGTTRHRHSIKMKASNGSRVENDPE